MCVWFEYQGKPCEVMATVAKFSFVADCNIRTLLLEDVYVALDGEQYVEARGHACYTVAQYATKLARRWNRVMSSASMARYTRILRWTIQSVG